MTRALKQPSSGSASCSWCDRPFQLRQSGGHAQRFCSPCCRLAFHAAVRRWTVDTIEAGVLNIDHIIEEELVALDDPGASQRYEEDGEQRQYDWHRKVLSEVPLPWGYGPTAAVSGRKEAIGAVGVGKSIFLLPIHAEKCADFRVVATGLFA
jgi:hypothetical protein